MRRFSLGGASLVVAALFVGMGSQALGDVIQYRQGSLPDGSYGHLGAEIFGGAQGQNWQMGGDNELRVGRGDSKAGYGEFRSLLGFNLVGIPTTATITDVTLSLRNLGAGWLEAPDIYVARVTALGALVEGNGLYSEDINGNGSGLTWLKYDQNTAWTAPGGDYGSALSTVSGVASTVPGGAPSAASFESLPLTAAAQDALANGLPLNLILFGNANQPGMWAFASDDNSDVNARPVLTVTYTDAAAVPLPTSAMMAVVGLAAVGLRRIVRRRSVVGEN